jgi:intraflagellar transport protein 80
MLRCTLAQADDPVYCICWGGADANQLLFCSSRFASIKAVQGAGATISNLATGQTVWKAHDALVLAADWNATTGLIVTGGEDCRYKVRPPLDTAAYVVMCFAVNSLYK